MKNDKIIVKIGSEEKQELTEAAAARDIPLSQFMREAARDRLAKERAAESQPEAAMAVTE